MNFVNKVICTLVICSACIPCTAFAYEDTEYEIVPAVSLYDENKHSSIQPTDEEVEFLEYLADEFELCHTEIEVPEKYRIPTSFFAEGGIYANYMGKFLQSEHPELFYVSGLSKYTADNAGIIKTVTAAYSMSNAEIDTAKKAISAELEKVKKLIGDDLTDTENHMSDTEKVLLVHDYIASNYEYDMTLYSNPGNESRRLDTMVMQKRGVCQGYSYLFKYIMDNIGIECENVMSDMCHHMWNKVNICVDGSDEKQWYNVDITADDPMLDMASNISHTYFLVNDDEIKTADAASGQNLHTAWNEYKWDNKTPATVSDSTDFSHSIIHDILGQHDIPGQMVYKDGTWYGFIKQTNSDNDSYNSLCTIDIGKNTAASIYTDSSKWYLYGQNQYIYQNLINSLVLYNGDIYFNSPDKVYKYNTTDNSAEVVYDFATKNPDKTDVSNTYLYGLRVRDNVLYAEYTTQPYTTRNENGEIISAKMDDLIRITTETYTFPCSSSAEFNTETREVTVTLSIPDEIKETAKVLIAEFGENGVLIGFAEREENQDTVTFKPDNDCRAIKSFIWGSDNSPMSKSISFAVPEVGNTDNGSENADNGSKNADNGSENADNDSENAA